MKVFVDTSFWASFILATDPMHDLAHAVFSKLPRPRLVTSELVLVETLNYASKKGPHVRAAFATLVSDLLELSYDSICVRQNENLLRGTLDLYRNRPDKSWSFVDCSSFIIMQERGISEALTADHHFEQAGFTTLLK